MAGVRVRVTMNHGELNRLLRSESGPTGKRVSEITRKTTNGAKRRAPVDTGKGRASIHGEVRHTGSAMVGTVSTPLKYMGYQHRGTGIYGPTGQPIRPKSGKFLVFAPKQGAPNPAGNRGGRGRLVFAREVKGVPPNPFLTDALRAVSPWPVREL